MSSSSASSSPEQRRKDKSRRRSRSRSRSPYDYSRSKPKREDSDHESRRSDKKHKKKHSRGRYSDSPEPHHHIKEEPGDDRYNRQGGRGSRHRYDDRDAHVRVKDEPGDRDDTRRRDRDNNGRDHRIKREPGSDEEGEDWRGGGRRQQMRARRENDARRRERRRQRDEDGEDYNFGGQGGDRAAEGEEDAEAEPVEKEKPNFEVSGKLAEETNTFRGVVIKYSEPPEARKPKKRWRLYPFKDGQSLPVLHIHRQSAFLMGRERKIADIPIDHPSCSKQHCVLQYRFVPFSKPDGRRGHVVRPYIIDLGSTNGTHVNNQRIEAQRYVELKEQDVLKFGFSSREYVLLHDKSKGDEGEDQGEAN